MHPNEFLLKLKNFFWDNALIENIVLKRLAILLSVASQSEAWFENSC